MLCRALLCGSVRSGSDDTREFAGNEKNIPLLSYSCDEIQTQALFCAGKAKLDSRMSWATARRRGLTMATMAEVTDLCRPLPFVGCYVSTDHHHLSQPLATLTPFRPLSPTTAAPAISGLSVVCWQYM